MTDETTNVDSTVTIAPNSTMTFATVSPEGKAYTAKEQFDQRLASPTWVKDATTPGTPAAADRARLVVLMAEEDARQRGEEFTRPAAEPKDAELTPPVRFRLPYEPDTVLTPEEQKLDGSMRGWLSASGMDADTGSRLAEDVNKLAMRDWTEESLDHHIESGRAALRNVWRENYKTNVALLDRFLGDIEQTSPGLNEFLQRAPFVLTDPLIAHRLLTIAKRRYGV